MSESSKESVTLLLEAACNGDKSALKRLFSHVNDELLAIAHWVRQKWTGNESINTVALVNEVFLRLVDQSRLKVNGRAHFFNVAAQAMRQILYNYAEKQNAEKRGGKAPKLSLDEVRALFVVDPQGTTIEEMEVVLMLEEVLQELEKVHPRQSQVVTCRFYSGMTVEETSVVLGVSTATVKRDWRNAKMWLYKKLTQKYGHGISPP